ncbi:hypothetical protein [Subtercola vilae]|uniref:Uncharacterized protein n=1 Tax=Subtercola vilae TaxID=2056433 RepID=A0A4T2BCX1_9MICO|nr:hypothetical protein [Subtercola vilae]TIH26676.1 hypothetical protein D4765_18895 [Subtercola vilae]
MLIEIAKEAMNTSTFIRPRVTTMVGGAGLALGAVIWLFGSSAQTPSFLTSTAPALVSAVVVLAAIIVLAIGARGESGITGASLISRSALILFGARSLLLIVFSAIPFTNISLAVAVGDSLIVLFALAAFAAAIVVAHAKILRGVSRWILFAVALCFTLVTVPTLTGLTQVGLFFSTPGVTLVMPGALLILGLSYFLYGFASTDARRTQIADSAKSHARASR